MIRIQRPYIVQEGLKSRCYCNILVDGDCHLIWFETDKEYEQYLVTERGDAFVIGLLHYAMVGGHDIVSDVPVTEELLYNVSVILIPTLIKTTQGLRMIRVEAESAPKIRGGVAVGTGCSCGIDSFDAIYMHYKTKYRSMDITHLCINNVGAFSDCYHEYGAMKVKEERYEKADELAKELGLPIIKTDSNFMEEFPQNHLLSHTFSSVFAIYMLQKFWRVYYYGSSGHDYSSFSLKNALYHEAAYYELLSLQCFSIEGMRIYSEGGEKTRLDKTKEVANFPLSRQYLHVCFKKPYNCSKCTKCMRTMLTLDALDQLDNFGDVFDLPYYRANINKYYGWLATQHSYGDDMMEPVFIEMSKRLEFKKYIRIERAKKILRPIKRLMHKKADSGQK